MILASLALLFVPLLQEVDQAPEVAPVLAPSEAQEAAPSGGTVTFPPMVHVDLERQATDWTTWAIVVANLALAFGVVFGIHRTAQTAEKQMKVQRRTAEEQMELQREMADQSADQQRLLSYDQMDLQREENRAAFLQQSIMEWVDGIHADLGEFSVGLNEMTCNALLGVAVTGSAALITAKEVAAGRNKAIAAAMRISLRLDPDGDPTHLCLGEAIQAALDEGGTFLTACTEGTADFRKIENAVREVEAQARPVLRKGMEQAEDPKPR